jgi:AraC family transcriptional regulator
MSNETRLCLDTGYKNFYPELLPRQPLLSSGKTLWNGISLDQILLPPGETPEYALDEFLLTINLGQGFHVERVLDKNLQNDFMVTGAVALCPMHVPQAIRWDRDVHILSLNLEHELLSRNAVEVFNREQFELIPHLIIHDTLIYQIGLGLKTQLQISGASSRLYAESAATFLAVHLLQTYSTQKFSIQEYEGGLSKQKLKQAIAYIQEHLAQEISLNAVADELGISRYYFCRLFRQSMGLSPHQYMIQQRVERAKQLLHRGGMSLVEVAIASGFTHQSHFHRHFKRLTGVTPKNFINLH